ncbi:hypothetical protein [Verminephrobacter eiseniae]|uniref:hypothetical protein n=1 Tax=Verminephrobacter eiseniae TaxID=364317 RepID=UPI002238B9C3|nr:hypothetical protein [Verminephrobacter eiseniae]
MAIAFESGLAAYPVGTFFGNGALIELVAQLNLEFAAVQTAFPIEFGNVEFLAFLANLVRDLVGDESGRGEDEAQFVDFFQLCLERFKCVHRKTGGGNLQAGAGLEGPLQVVAEQVGDVVDEFHQVSAFEGMAWPGICRSGGADGEKEGGNGFRSSSILNLGVSSGRIRPQIGPQASNA